MHLKFITNIRKKNILQEKIEKLFKAKEDIDFDIWIKFLRDNAESTFATIIVRVVRVLAANGATRTVPRLDSQFVSQCARVVCCVACSM